MQSPKRTKGEGLGLPPCVLDCVWKFRAYFFFAAFFAGAFFAAFFAGAFFAAFFAGAFLAAFFVAIFTILPFR